MAMLVFFGNGLPEAETGCFPPVPYDKCHDLPRSTTHCRPYPTGLLFFLDKAPDAHPIREQHLVLQAEASLEREISSEQTL
jgi:hypothetical protein